VPVLPDRDPAHERGGGRADDARGRDAEVTVQNTSPSPRSRAAYSRQWLVGPRRIAPLIRNLRRNTDPLFRQSGISLDEG
jgi:hypothetical protein